MPSSLFLVGGLDLRPAGVGGSGGPTGDHGPHLLLLLEDVHLGTTSGGG